MHSKKDGTGHCIYATTLAPHECAGLALVHTLQPLQQCSSRLLWCVVMGAVPGLQPHPLRFWVQLLDAVRLQNMTEQMLGLVTNIISTAQPWQ